MDDLPVLHSQRLTLFIPGPQDAERCIRFNRDNEAFLAPWEPPMTPAHFDLAAVRSIRERALERARADRGYQFAIVVGDLANAGPLLGWVNLSNVIRGIFQACHLGYSLDRQAQGQGYMTEALRTALPYAFNTLGLHRVMANYMPHNQRSAMVLRRLGFSVEGSAKAYLFIGGQWRDHVLTALVNPEPLVPPGQTAL
jgi:[ribosomal protein S5]-alanine N-acetyltransferase